MWSDQRLLDIPIVGVVHSVRKVWIGTTATNLLAGDTISALGIPFKTKQAAVALSGLEQRLTPLLSAIAGMVDVTSYLSLGGIFTAHITGNLVVLSADLVRGEALNLAQALAIPVFILAVAGTWLVARASGRHGSSLARLLLRIQFLLLTVVLMFSVITKPSANPRGVMAGIAVMLAVCSMASQFALIRLALPRTLSTAVMTGNLTNAVLSLLDRLSGNQAVREGAGGRLSVSLQLLFGFLVGCAVGAAAVSLLGDWAWSLPAALAGVVVAMR